MGMHIAAERGSATATPRLEHRYRQEGRLMTGNFYIVPPVEVTHTPRSEGIGHYAGCFDGAPIVFEGVQPDQSRAWYRHCYGVRGFAWAVHGSFERTYYFAPDYVDGNLRPHLESTIVSLWAVIRSELEAAIAAPNIHGEAWQKFHAEHFSTPAGSESGSAQKEIDT